MSPLATLLVLAFIGTSASPPVLAQFLKGGQEYTACMRLARIAPEEAFETALAWGDRGGGAGAKHCAAVALFTGGHYREAAERMERLAEGLRAEAAVRAKLLAQSAQAWHQAGEIARAHAAQTVALKLAPRDPDLLTDRAMVLAESGRYWEAIDDLNLALEIDRGDVESLVLRASAYRYVDALELARQDLDRALELSPNNPEALLESGIVHRLSGDGARARQAWLSVLRLHDGTPAAAAARRNLEKLDVKSD